MRISVGYLILGEPVLAFPTLEEMVDLFDWMLDRIESDFDVSDMM
jgi:hypothetical protein